MKVTFLFLLIYCAFAAFSSNLATADNKSFCKTMFGSAAQTTFEPVESNRGGVADTITGKSVPIKIDGVKPPTGFRCQIISERKASCPTGTHLNKKRAGVPVCISKVYSLKELCPNEIDDVLPNLKESVCASKQNNKSSN